MIPGDRMRHLEAVVFGTGKMACGLLGPLLTFAPGGLLLSLLLGKQLGFYRCRRNLKTRAAAGSRTSRSALGVTTTLRATGAAALGIQSDKSWVIR